MRAALYDRTGPAREVLRIVELPTPRPGPGEVWVKISWSGVNPSDVKTRAGVRTKTLPFPYIVPHSDGAGVIDEVGPDIPRSRIGERVWTWNAAWGRPLGTAAQFVVLPARQAVPLPSETDLDAGACLGIPALTAYHAVSVDGGVAGKTVLVAGGAGAVGHYAVQFAKLMGASTILATVSGPEKAALARAAGADVVLNYKTEDVPAAVRGATLGMGVDRIVEVDFGANVKFDLEILKRDGDIVVYGSNDPEIVLPFLPMILKNVRLRFFIVYNLGDDVRKQAISRLNGMLETGRLIHNIATRLPLDQIADAHDMVQQGRSVGNVVLEVK